MNKLVNIVLPSLAKIWISSMSLSILSICSVAPDMCMIPAIAACRARYFGFGRS